MKPHAKKVSIVDKNLTWKFATLLMTLIACIAIGTSITLWRELRHARDPAKQEIRAQKETQKIVREVGRLMDLPEGTPQIALVSDPEALKKWQPFFDKSMAGDSVIIYENQVILYRPSTHKIINVGPVNRTTPEGEEK